MKRSYSKDAKQQLFILAIADRGIVSHAKAFADERLAQKALVEYLRKYHLYDGPNHIQDVIEWLNQHDEYLDVKIEAQEASAAGVVKALQRVHNLLYLDSGPEGEFHNPDKEWSPDTLDAIAEIVRPLFPQPSISGARDDPDDPEELTPKDRAEFVRRIEQVSPYEEGLDAQDNMVCPSEFITDLLTDIRHYCDVKDVDFHACDRSAYNHYLKEREHGKEVPNG